MGKTNDNCTKKKRILILIGAAEEIVQADLNADYDSDAEDDTDDTKNG